MILLQKKVSDFSKNFGQESFKNFDIFEVDMEICYTINS